MKGSVIIAFLTVQIRGKLIAELRIIAVSLAGFCGCVKGAVRNRIAGKCLFRAKKCRGQTGVEPVQFDEGQRRVIVRYAQFFPFAFGQEGQW